MKATLYCFAFAALFVFTVSGCSSNPEKVPMNSGSGTAKKGKADDHDHEHGDDHDHDHAKQKHSGHGPNGGDLFDFPNDDFVGELGYKSDNNVITVFLLANDEKAAKPIKADSITVNYKGGKEPETYVLEAVNKTADGMASQFALDSKPLSLAVFMGCEIVLKDGDKEIVVNLPKMERHNH